MAGLSTGAADGGPPTVHKFGGSAFAEVSGFLAAARHVERQVRAQRRPAVVVVSAMSGTTGRLAEVLREVDPRAPASVVSALLSTGETVSTALLAAAFHALGLQARALSAHETGFVAAGAADRAGLEFVDRDVLRSALATCPVLVLPGGQAVDCAGVTVMLGRNSSDLSAVAAAAAVGAPSCDFYSDVPGICTADPYLVPTARTLPHVSYSTMRLMARSGAKVLHEGAVAYAEDAGIRLRCLTLPPEARYATEVSSGRPTAAVILHRTGEVVGFGGAEARDAARDQLTAEGLDAVPVAVGGEPYLVVTVAGHEEVLVRCAPSGRRHLDLRLLTVVHADGRAEHQLVPVSRAAAEARRRHCELYPESAAAAPTATTPKRRSAHSDLLVAPGAVGTSREVEA